MLSRITGLWLLIVGFASWFEPGIDGIGPPGCIACRPFGLAISVISVVLGAAVLAASLRAPQPVGSVRG
jgi:hypothetical protein